MVLRGAAVERGDQRRRRRVRTRSRRAEAAREDTTGAGAMGAVHSYGRVR
jgi:hypothetical protein